MLGHFDHVVDVALRVGPPRDGHADEVHVGGDFPPTHVPAEHRVADLAGPDPPVLVDRRAEALGGELGGRDVRQQRPRVNVHGVASRRLHDRVADLGEPLRQIFHRAEPILEVVLVQDFLEPLGDRVQVAAREPTVRRKAFRENQEIAALLRPVLVVHPQKAADVDQSVLLRAHRAAVRQAVHLAGDGRRGLALVAGLPQLDEVGVLGEAAGVQKERDAVAVAQHAGLAEVLHRDRLPAA